MMTHHHLGRTAHQPAHDPLGRAWALPGDATCAGVARSLAGDALSGMGLRLESIRDAELMVSELATNACTHARGHPPHELWLYRLAPPAPPATPPKRKDEVAAEEAAEAKRPGAELICAVFDARPGLLPPSEREPMPLDGARVDFGRGLRLVAELSGGRWGVHLSRSRLGSAVPGKVVWFGLPLPSPVPLARDPALPGTAALDPPTAARTLKEHLVRRGIGPIYCSHRDGLWVVGIPYGLTVWVRDGHFALPGSPVPAERPLDDLAAVVEHLVRRYEQHRLADV